MVLMKYFCFYFPVRLGCIITSIISAGQGAACLAYVIMYDEQYFKKWVKDVQEHIEDYSSNQAFDMSLEIIDEYTSQLRLGALIFNGCFIGSCVLDIVAASMVWRWLAVPYIILDLLRLGGVLACYIIIMMIFKKQLNLGVLIAACSVGGFFILFLGYMWGCSVALFQIVGIVKSKSYQKSISLGSPAPAKIQRNITISTLTGSTKPLLEDVKPAKNEKIMFDNEMFASDFSEYYRRPNYKM